MTAILDTNCIASCLLNNRNWLQLEWSLALQNLSLQTKCQKLYVFWPISWDLVHFYVATTSSSHFFLGVTNTRNTTKKYWLPWLVLDSLIYIIICAYTYTSLLTLILFLDTFCCHRLPEFFLQQRIRIVLVFLWFKKFLLNI